MAPTLKNKLNTIQELLGVDSADAAIQAIAQSKQVLQATPMYLTLTISPTGVLSFGSSLDKIQPEDSEGIFNASERLINGLTIVGKTLQDLQREQIKKERLSLRTNGQAK